MTCLALQPIAARDLGRAGLAAAERPAFGEQLRSRRAMDRAIDAAAAEQRAVRRVDDRVDVERGDVGHHDFKARAAGLGDKKRIATTASAMRPAYHAASASALTAGSIVLRTPMSSKCASRKRRAARLPARCSVSKKSKSLLSRLPSAERLVLAQHDAMHVDRTVLARRAGQFALVEQVADELDHPHFRRQRRVEGDLVDAVQDVLGRRRRGAPHQRIDLHHQHVGAVHPAQQRKDRRVAGVAAVPVRHAVDLDGAKHVGQRGRRHHRVGGDLLAREHAELAGVHVGRRDEQPQLLALADRVEVDEAFDQVLQRIDVERIEIVGRQESATRRRPRPAPESRPPGRTTSAGRSPRAAVPAALPSKLAARQNSASRCRAASGPPRASPSASMTALTAPADAPEMPSIESRPSSSR